MGLDRVTREQLMNGNWYATIKGQLFDESDFHLISNSDFLKISIIGLSDIGILQQLKFSMMTD